MGMFERPAWDLIGAAGQGRNFRIAASTSSTVVEEQAVAGVADLADLADGRLRSEAVTAGGQPRRGVPLPSVPDGVYGQRR